MRRHHAQGGGVRPEILRRIVVYGVLIWILSTASCSFFANLTYLPATPDLLLCAVVAIGLLDSRRAAAVVGIVGGFCLDALGGVGAALSPILYLLVVLLVGSFAEKALGSFWAWLVLILPTLLLRALFTTLAVLLRMGGVSFSPLLRQILLPEAVVTLLLGIPVYFICSLCMLLLRDRRERSLR